MDDGGLFLRLQSAKRVLVLDLGYLGDTIHIIPALNCIRQALPAAQLHVMVAEHVQDILKLTPWVDRVMGYPRFPKRLPWYKEMGWMWQLAQNPYDVVINFSGSDRAVRLAWCTRSPIRIGRVPQTQRRFGLWKQLQTHCVYEPHHDAPTFQQHWNALKKIGFPGDAPSFPIHIPHDIQNHIDEQLQGQSGFFHLSPFTTENGRELQPSILAEFLNQVHDDHPGYTWAISCSPTQRERTKMDHFISYLKFQPSWIFKGTLSVLELAAVINRCSLHIGGDSGALHIARVLSKPALSWFYNYPGLIQWMPQGPQYKSLIGQKTPQALVGISSQALFDALQELIH